MAHWGLLSTAIVVKMKICSKGCCAVVGTWLCSNGNGNENEEDDGEEMWWTRERKVMAMKK